MNVLPVLKSLLLIIAFATVAQSPVEPGIVIYDNCQNGTDMIKKMLAAASDLNNYSSDFTMVVHKDKSITKEKGIIYFRKPHLLRVEVKEGPKKGALAILSSDGKVHGHLGGVLKYFQSSVSPNSDLARALNGFPLADSDFYSLVLYLSNMLKKGDLSLVTNQPLLTDKANLGTYILDIYTDNNIKTGKPVLLKRIYVDPKTYLPIFWEDYTLGKLWSESSWHNLKYNLVLPDSFFSP